MIETGHIQNTFPDRGVAPPETFHPPSASVEFASYLREVPVQAARQEPPHPLNQGISPSPYPSKAASAPPSEATAAAAYEKQGSPGEALTDWEKYKDDQLLSNPGGDYYDLKKGTFDADTHIHQSFWDRIGKDLSDVWGNVTSFFENIFMGAETHYRDENNQIQRERERGILGSVVDFFTDLGSAFSFGLWRPDGEAEPEGFLERAGFFLSKMKEAIFGDLIQGASGSAIRAGENVVLAGWNLLEVVPDATLGNWDEGRKLTTTFFDNGQVIIDYMTDIIPTGEAWLRVHALNLEDIKDPKAPVLYNIEMPERFEGDVRWSRVRNTPFRKTIETIGSLLADIAAVKVIGDMNWSSERKHE